MKIVLDTNVIVNHWQLRGQSFDIFQKSLELSNDTLVVPQIVILEAKNQYREKLQKRYEDLLSIGNSFKSMLTPKFQFDLPQFDLDDLCREYSISLDQRLRELNAIIPDHSDITHDSIVTRDLGRRSPFRRSGKGYRDTLLWEVILNKVVNRTDRTILITSDLEDFGNNKKPILNDHLCDDLMSKGLRQDCVQLMEKIEDFNDQYAKPRLHTLNEIKERLDRGEDYPLSISDWFEENMHNLREVLTPEVGSLIMNDILRGYDIDEPITVEWIETPESFGIDNVFELDTNRILIDISFLTDVRADFFVFKSDYYTMPDDIPIGIMEWDWNDHYAWMTATLKVPISLSLTFNLEEDEVEDYEVSFTEYFGRCRHCDEPLMSDAAETCPSCGRSLF
jgi:hypothetical protein